MRKALAAALCLSALLPGGAYALNPDLAVTHYRHRAWLSDQTEGGPPVNTVFSIAQTRDGYLWLATQEGLARFDGVRFVVFNTRNTPEIRHNDMWQLLEDRAGNLWIGTDGGGLNRLAGGRFTALTTKHGLSNDSIGARFEDREGSLWIGTDAGGLNRLKDNTFIAYAAPEGLPNDNARSVLEDRHAGTRRSAHYTNIPPGHYTFRVMASNNDGVYQRRAFGLVYVLVLVLVLALALALALAAGLGMRLQRARVRRLRARERALLKLVSERKQAEDALRSANRRLELRVIDLSRARQAPAPGPQVAVGPLPEPGAPPELGQLLQDFSQLLEQLSRRECDLQEARDALAQEVGDKNRANQDLQQALQHLKIAQSQLVQNEKLASLGSLVAGIAHEVNTPIGVAVTAASTLQDWARRLHDQHGNSRLTRTELDAFVGIATDSTQILLKNLQRAADLIQSFKQVAVDQASGERRRFELKGYIDEVLLSLAPRLNRSPHQVSVDCPPTLVVDSNPGAFAQIMTNLISNSLTHAFPAGRAGQIRIEVREDGDAVVLRYSDDGVGIPAEHLGRIFDPFFTTKRGSGGSGLGMHIVYNLVTQLLGGTITVSSRPGAGTEFAVKFPAELRQAA